MDNFYISSKKIKKSSLNDFKRDEGMILLLDQYDLMESHIVYFSAGESKIKNFLVSEEPIFSL